VAGTPAFRLVGSFGLPRMDPATLRRELALYAHWYNDHRPHQGLRGRTPDEVYFGRAPANEWPRHEPRASWPSDGSCAAPSTEIQGRRGAVLRLEVGYLEGRRHLPVVQRRRAA